MYEVTLTDVRRRLKMLTVSQINQVLREFGGSDLWPLRDGEHDVKVSPQIACMFYLHDYLQLMGILDSVWSFDLLKIVWPTIENVDFNANVWSSSALCVKLADRRYVWAEEYCHDLHTGLKTLATDITIGDRRMHPVEKQIFDLRALLAGHMT